MSYIAAFFPIVFLLLTILIVWWVVSLLLQLKTNSNKQVEQNKIIIELLREFNKDRN
jgi:uncharacterized membrane-anchored protein